MENGKDSFVEDSFVEDAPVKKKVESAPTNGVQEVSTQGSGQVAEPLLESGGKDSEPIDLPKTYETTDQSTYKNLVAGQGYKIRRGGVTVTGVWNDKGGDYKNGEFVIKPIHDFAPKVKPRGVVESIAESILPVPNLETEEEIIARNMAASEIASQEAAKKDVEIKTVAQIPLLQQLDALKRNGSEEDFNKIYNTPITSKDIPLIRFQKGAEGQVLQNLQTNLPTEEFNGELVDVPLSKVLPEDYKKAKTVGELYDMVSKDAQGLQSVTQQLGEFDRIVKEKQVEGLPQEQKDYLKSLEGSPLYNDELVKTLEQSGKTENVVKAAGIGLSGKLESIYKLGNNIGLDDKQMEDKMRQEIAYDNLFRTKPEGFAAEISSGVSGMIPDIVAGAVTGGTGMMASMLSTMPNNLLKEYYADKFAKGETPKVADAWKYVTTSMAAQAPMLYGAGKIGTMVTKSVGKTTLARAGELLSNVAKKAGTDATIFGFLGTYGQNKINKAFDVAENDDYLHSALTMGVIGALFGLKEGAGKVFKSKISEKTRNEIDYITSYLPDNLVRADVAKLVKDGKVLPSDGDATLQRMENYRMMRSQIPGEITFEQAEKIYPLWEEKRELEKQIEGASSEFKSVIGGKIEDIDRKIIIKAAIPLTSEEKAEYNKLVAGEAENKQIDKARLKYLRDRMEAAKEVKEEKKEAEKVEEPKPEPTPEKVEVKEEAVWYRGVRKGNEAQGDKFYSNDESVSGDYGVENAGDKPKLEQLSKEELPKNPLVISGKEELAEIIGYQGDPLTEKMNLPVAEKFDTKAKEYAKSKGHDGIIYEEGTMGARELHVFEKDTPQSEVAETPVGKKNEVGNPAYKKTEHKQGRTITKTIADGTKLTGTYKIVSADDVVASHNEETFSQSEGYPTNEQGTTINDRDYSKDTNAQTEVHRIAHNLDDRAISQTPVVTKDGIVIDGNNRTMSRKLAAKNKTDKAYTEALKEQAELYGLKPEDVDAVKNPMLVFEPKEDLPYDTKTLSRFNKAEKKEKSPVERAVEVSKTITDFARRQLGEIYSKAAKPSDVTSDPKSIKEVVKLLQAENIIQPNELPRYFDVDRMVATKEGVSFMESLMMGSALDEKAIRLLDNENMGNVRQKILKAIVPLTQNAALGENSLTRDIEGAIDLVNKAKQEESSVLDAVRQLGIFEAGKYSAEELWLAHLLDGEGFGGFLKRYNGDVGKDVLFEGKLTKDRIIDNALRQTIDNYEKVRPNLRSSDTRGQEKVQGDNGGGKQESAREEQQAEGGKESLPEKVKGKDKIARGLDKLTDALNTKNKIIGDEERPKVIDALRDIAEGMMEEFKISADQAIAKLKDYIKGKISDEDFDSVKDDVRAALESSEGKKKTLVTERAYEGEVREGVKRELEKIGLTRDIDKLDVAQEKAKQFVKSVGEETALDAVRNGDVDGATAAFVFHEVTESLNRKAATSTDAAEVARLEKIQAELLDEWGNRQWKSGAFNSAMQKILVESDLGYNIQRKIQEYKDVNNGEIPAAVEARFREYDAQLKEVNKKLAEAEERARIAEEKQAIADIKESIEREKKTRKYKTVRGKALIAEGLDDLATALGSRKMAAGDRSPSVAKALEKIGRGLIDEGIASIENVAEKVKEYVNEKFPGKLNFDDYADGFSDRVAAMEGEKTTGKLNIPHSLIRDLVEEGIDNMDDLVRAVHRKYPKYSEREVRDAISGYGKVANLNKEEVEVSIRKMKRGMRVISALEDIAEKKRPMRSGAQRDKIDAEERALQKELREAMKELPVDEADLEQQLKTQLDATKQRVKNQMEDLQREIDKGELTPKNARSVTEDAELKALKEKRDALKKEHEAIFKDEEYKEAKRLDLTKKATQRRIEDLQRRLRDGDFSKKERKPLVSDSELIKLKAEKLRIQGEYDKELYKAKLKNRTTAEKIKDSVWELWGIPRVLMATGEMSFIGIQGLKQSIAHPLNAAKAFKNALKFMASEKNADKWLNEIKSQEWYPALKQSKLALTEPHAEITAREELFYSGWSNLIWDGIGRAVTSPARLKSAEAYTKAQEMWSKLNPLKAMERGAVGYLDTIRVERFLDGKQILEAQGKTFENSPQDYKDVSDAINTMTGRASLGRLEQQADLLSKVFFSPRNWASGIKTATPYALYHFGRMTPTAQKMAIADFSKFVGLTTSMVLMAASKLNNDDDKETGVEFDPRSTDFMKIKLGNIRVDPWGGMQQQIVLSSRLMADGLMRAVPSLGIQGGYKKDGYVMPLGISHKTPSAGKIIGQQALNKLNPTADLLYNYLNTSIKKDGTRVNDYGQEYTVKSELEDKFHPIFWGTVSDLLKDDPTALDGLLVFYAFFGGGVNVYDNKPKQTPKTKYNFDSFKFPKFGN